MSNTNKEQNNEGEPIDTMPTNMNSKGKRKDYKERSGVWPYFIRFKRNGIPRAKCIYCPKEFSGITNNRTSTLWAHVRKCEANPINDIN